MVGHSSCVVVHGRFNDLRGLLSALDHCLNMLHGLRGKVLLAGLPAHPCRHVLDEEELAVILQRVGYFSFNHRFFHHITSSICLPNPQLNPEFRIGFVHRDNLDQRPRRVAALNVKRSSSTCESQDQATRTVLILGIILDHFASARYGLLQFGHADVTHDSLIHGVLREFILARAILSRILSSNAM